jgi:hypothetical protein
MNWGGWPGINCISYEAVRRYRVGSDRLVMLDIAQLNLLRSLHDKSDGSLTQLAATASGSSKQALHIPDAVCTVLELLMMGGETA